MSNRPLFANDVYWFVDGDHTQVYSNKRGIFVPINDPDYAAWLAAGNQAADVQRQSLGAYLAQFGMRPTDPTMLLAYQDAAADDVAQHKLFRIAFNHENRIRVLENRPQITLPQFLAAIRSLL